MTFRVGSCFSGCGALDRGLERAGFEIAWQSEIDPQACAVLRRHWPQTPNLGDIRGVRGADHAPVDVVVGGFPCTGASVAGKRRGLADDRTGLFYELARVIRECRPRFALLENVPGLLNIHRGRDFAAVLGTLADCGALDIAWRILDSRYFRVPQRRRRVFLVVDFGGERAGEVLHEPRRGARHSQAVQAPRQEVAGTLGGGSGRRGWASDTDRMTYVPVSAALTTPSGERQDPTDETYVVAFHPTQDPRSGPVSPALGASSGGMGVMVAPFDPVNVTSKANRTRVEFGSPAGTLHQKSMSVLTLAVRGREGGAQLEWRDDGIYNALRAADGGSSRQSLIAGSFGVRRLLPVETERLQGLEDDFTRYDEKGCEIADSNRYRLTGNAVTEPVAYWIGKRLHTVMEQETRGENR